MNIGIVHRVISARRSCRSSHSNLGSLFSAESQIVPRPLRSALACPRVLWKPWKHHTRKAHNEALSCLDRLSVRCGCASARCKPPVVKSQRACSFRFCLATSFMAVVGHLVTHSPQPIHKFIVNGQRVINHFSCAKLAAFNANSKERTLSLKCPMTYFASFPCVASL